MTQICCTAMANGVFKPRAMSITVGVRDLYRHWQKQQHLVSVRMISIFNLGMERSGYAHPLNRCEPDLLHSYGQWYLQVDYDVNTCGSEGFAYASANKAALSYCKNSINSHLWGWKGQDMLTPSTNVIQICCTATANGVCKSIVISIPVTVRSLYRH